MFQLNSHPYNSIHHLPMKAIDKLLERTRDIYQTSKLKKKMEIVYLVIEDQFKAERDRNANELKLCFKCDT